MCDFKLITTYPASEWTIFLDSGHPTPSLGSVLLTSGLGPVVNTIIGDYRVKHRFQILGSWKENRHPIFNFYSLRLIHVSD